MDATEALTEFVLEQELRNNSEATIRFYRGVLERFLCDVDVHQVREIDRVHVVRWKLSPVSLQTYDRCLRVFCNWLVRRGLLPTSPLADLPKVTVPRGTGEYVVFSRDDVQAVLAAAKRKGQRNRLRDTALVAVLLDTGVRASEAASLTLTDIDWTEYTLRVQGKTGRREVPVHKSLRYLRACVSRERVAAGRESTVFTSRTGAPFTSRNVTYTIRRLTDAARVQATKRGPHTFRHTFAVEFLRSGGDVFSLMRILGHSQVATTEKYVHRLMGDVLDLHARHSPGNRWL